MVLIDFSFLMYKNLFSSIRDSTDENNKKIKKHDGYYIFKEYKSLFLHKLFTDLRYIFLNNKHNHNDFVLCLDNHDTTNWRKDIYPLYKAQRKKVRKETGIDFTKFYEYMNTELMENLKYFPFKILDVQKTEGDDIIAVLTEEFLKKEDVLIISVDKDFKQLFKYTFVPGYKKLTIYNPITTKTIKEISQKELRKWENEHVMLGDVSDNIGKIVEGTEFSKEFMKFLEKNDIYITNVNEFLELNISNKIMNDFVEQYPDKEVYKKVRFGPKALEKFMENYDENMKNPIIRKNYERNKRLILFDYIPNDIRKSILEEYKKCEINVSLPKIMEFFNNNHLYVLGQNFQDFYKSSKVSISSTNSKNEDSSSDFVCSSNNNSESAIDELLSEMDEW